MSDILHTTPSQDGYYMPAEYEKQHGCLMIWPERPGSWNYGAKKAREAFSQVIWKISECEQVYVLAGKAVIEDARQILTNSKEIKKLCKPNYNNIHIIEAETDDAWSRDTGATFVVPKKCQIRQLQISDKMLECGATNMLDQMEDNSPHLPQRRAIDWQFNAWGGSYDGLYASWDKDQEVARKIAEVLVDDIYDARHFVLEGGSIHVDGEGTLITTEECLLSPGRNPDMSREDIENELKQYLGVEKIIWLPEGIYNDETNGHVDNFCCFTAPGEVLLAWTDDENDPQHKRSKLALEILENAIDAKGRKFTVRKLPIPARPICITEEDLKGYEFEEGEDFREVGERLAASYVNFYIANDSVLVPQFGDIHDKLALDIIGECFHDREVVGIYARDILTGGGNIHCITQQIPECCI